MLLVSTMIVEWKGYKPFESELINKSLQMLGTYRIQNILRFDRTIEVRRLSDPEKYMYQMAATVCNKDGGVVECVVDMDVISPNGLNNVEFHAQIHPEELAQFLDQMELWSCFPVY